MATVRDDLEDVRSELEAMARRVDRINESLMFELGWLLDAIDDLNRGLITTGELWQIAHDVRGW
jgi:hypothetical protein